MQTFWIRLVAYNINKLNKNTMNKVYEILEEIKEHQMQTVQLARTTKVYKLAEKAQAEQLILSGVSKSAFVLEIKTLIKEYKKEIKECRKGKNFHCGRQHAMYGVYSGKLKKLNSVVLNLNKLLLKYDA
jgi:hypothetical protein